MSFEVNHYYNVTLFDNCPCTTNVRTAYKSKQIGFVVSHGRVYDCVTRTVNLLCCYNRDVIVFREGFKLFSYIALSENFIAVRWKY